jgi:hypothetical protein
MYETKVLLSALGDIVVRADSLEEVYESIQSMANVEGLLLKPYAVRKELIKELKKKND